MNSRGSAVLGAALVSFAVACSASSGDAPRAVADAAADAPSTFAGDADAGADLDAAPPRARPDPSCPAVWDWSTPTAAGTSGSVTFGADGMTLDATGALPSNALALWQSPGADAFSATFTVADVSGNGSFDGVKAFFDDGIGDRVEAELIAVGATMNVLAASFVHGQSNSVAKGTSAHDGTLTIESSGGDVTITVTAGGVSESVKAFLAGTPSARLGIALDTSADATSSLTPHAHARVTSFEATGPTTSLKSDHFTCDSRD